MLVGLNWGLGAGGVGRFEAMNWLDSGSMDGLTVLLWPLGNWNQHPHRRLLPYVPLRTLPRACKDANNDAAVRISAIRCRYASLW